MNNTSKAMTYDNTGVYTYNDNTYSFNFKTYLSAYEKAVFVRTVVDTIVDDTNYDSVLRDTIFDYTVITMFTDIDTSSLKTYDNMGNVITNIDDVEDFLLSTNIVEIVEKNVMPTLFKQLNNAVDKSIAYRTGIHPSPLSDALANLVNTIEKKVDEIDSTKLMEMANVLSGMTGEMTPESLSENVVKAYMKSDIYKQNLANVVKAKKNTGKNKNVGKNKKNEIKIDEDLGEAIRAVVKENKIENKTEN